MSSQDKEEGGWIFLSHSNKDFEKVREVRNELEKLGRKPIMFYLKCLEDDNSILPDLLRREIAAREWFILCDSSNAQASQYVRDEVKLVKSMEGIKFEVVDLSKGLPAELYKLIRISKRATVFLSYARSDNEMATRIGDALRKHDYRVWTDAELSPAENFKEAIGVAIDEAIQNGFVLLLLSEASLKSQYFQQEIFYALKKAAASHNSNIVPVVISNLSTIQQSLPPDLALALGDIQWFDLTAGPFDERVEELIRNLKIREME